MSECKFESGNPFKSFTDFVRFTSRHVLDEPNRQFLENVVEASQSRRLRMRTGTRLWRAQVAHLPGSFPLAGGRSYPWPLPVKPERMKPQADRACEVVSTRKGFLVFTCRKRRKPP